VGRQAVEEHARGGDAYHAAEARQRLASILLRAGRPTESLAEARSALELESGLAVGLGDEEAASFRKMAAVDAVLGVLASLALQVQDAKSPDEAAAEAVHVLETGRALLLAKTLTNPQSLLAARIPEEVRRAEVASRERLAAAQGRATALQGRRDAPRSDVRAALEEVRAARAEREAAVERLQRAGRGLGDVVYPRPLDLESLRARLDPSTAFVLYSLPVDETAAAVVVRRNGARLVSLGQGPEVVVRAQAWRERLATRKDDRREAARLYDAVLAPLEEAIGDATRLLVSPDGILTFVPLEALVRRGEGTDERVVERWEVAYEPSGTVYASLRTRAAVDPQRGRRAIVLGDPIYPLEAKSSGDRAETSRGVRGVGNLGRLEASGDEARAIAALFPDEDRVLLLRGEATVARLLEASRRPGERLAALHLACHGILDAENPRRSGLVLGGGEVLTMDDLYGLDVPADLVVLSACHTGEARILLGEGVMGLARAFFVAGAPRVVVSDWAVDDASTKELMVAFYEGIRRDGLAPSAALRRAKLAMLRAGGPHAHPHHWAAFVLWGV
jgi:CHAT domain-containing protein